MRKLICAAVMLICTFLIMGLAGSLECDTLSASETIIRSVPVILVMLASCKIGGFFNA